MDKRQITIVVAVITNDQGDILLGQRNQPDIPEEHGKWEFIGGGIDFGETPEDALKREAMEEAGVEIEIVRLLPKIYTKVWQNQIPLRQIIILSYECKIISGEAKPSDPEISELQFVKLDQVQNYQTLPNVQEIIDLLKS